MKVFFGDALQDMIAELRGQAVNNVRLHVLSEIDGERLRLSAHITTLCNNQVYEAVLKSETGMGEVARDQRKAYIKKAAEKAREQVAEELSGFEVRRGILQQ